MDADNQDVVLPNDAFIKTTTIDILKERAHNPTSDWSPEVDFDDFISGLLHWQESASTSPSSWHVGLYKALATAFCNSSDAFSDSSNAEDPKDQSTQEKAAQIPIPHPWARYHRRYTRVLSPSLDLGH
jgi:hypothetical protein